MRSCQIREPVNCGSARSAAFGRGRGQRDERVRRAMPAARGRRVATRSVDGALERGDRIRRRAAGAELIEREQRDVRVAIAAAADRRGARVGVAARARGCAAPRAGRSASRRARPAVSTLVRRVARPPLAAPAAGAAARIASRRTCASGSCAARARAPHRRPPPAAISASSARRRTRAPVERLAVAPARASRRSSAIASRSGARSLRCSRTSASKPFATPSRSVDRLGARRHLEQRPLRALRPAPRSRTAGGRCVSQIAARTSGVRFDLQPRDERRRRRRRSRTARRRLARASSPARPARWRSPPPTRTSGSGCRSDGHDVGDERRPLEPAERADRDAHGLRVAAARAGPDDREIARRRRAAIFGLEDREPRRGGVCAARRGTHAKTAEHAEHAENDRSCDLCELRGFVADHHARRWRVAAEYSSICAVRSSGYEIVDVGDLARRRSSTASSRGMTKPV